MPSSAFSACRKPGDPISRRMRQPAEWVPNGRTTLWFDAANGALLCTRDALKMPGGALALNMVYPLYAAMVVGYAYKLLMMCVGLALTMLGSLAVWSFWFRGSASVRRRQAAAPISPPE